MSQVIFNILINTSKIFLIGAGFSLLYRPTRAFYFTHAIVITSGAYFAFTFKEIIGTTILISMIAALGLSCLLGCFLEFSLYRLLRQRNSSPMMLLLVSLGLYIVCQNVISLIFGDASKGFSGKAQMPLINIFQAYITIPQIWIMSVAISSVTILSFLLKKTDYGKAFRAVCIDSELAKISGIRSDSVIFIGAGAGSLLAGLAGALIAFDTNISPTMGMGALMSGLVAAVIGGNSIFGISLAAVFLSTAENVGILIFGGRWEDVATLVFLILFLIFKKWFGKNVF